MMYDEKGERYRRIERYIRTIGTATVRTSKGGGGGSGSGSGDPVEKSRGGSRDECRDIGTAADDLR